MRGSYSQCVRGRREGRCSPKTFTVPCVGRSSPARMRRSVDFTCAVLPNQDVAATRFEVDGHLAQSCKGAKKFGDFVEPSRQRGGHRGWSFRPLGRARSSDQSAVAGLVGARSGCCRGAGDSPVPRLACLTLAGPGRICWRIWPESRLAWKTPSRPNVPTCESLGVVLESVWRRLGAFVVHYKRAAGGGFRRMALELVQRER